MKVAVLRFKGAFKDETPTLRYFDAMGFRQFMEAEKAHFPAFYVMRPQHLKVLLKTVNGNEDVEKLPRGKKKFETKGLPPIMYRGKRVDQGEKKEGRSLASYFPKLGRPVALMGSFRSQKTLTNAVFATISHAKDKGDENMFILGASDGVFESLADGAPVFPFTHLTGTENLIRLLPEMDIPEDLEKAIKGNSSEMKLLRKFVVIASQLEDPVKTPVLLLGDSGTGKGLVARSIHRMNPKRAHHPLVTVNCAAIPENLLEAELFGIMGGVATGVLKRKGKWEEAGEGYLFLDEIGDMSKEMQAKILTALNDCKFVPVGGSYPRDEVECKCGIIAATNQPLQQMVDAGTFREDLYFRLNKMLIPTYPLSRMGVDLDFLLREFWPNQEKFPLSDEVIAELNSYSWPGNVREMKAQLIGLASFFSTKPLSVEMVRAYREHLGVGQARKGASAGGSGDSGPLRVLRHLHQAQEIISSCQRAMQGTLGGNKNPASLETLKSSMQINLMRLNGLCVDARWFGENEIYTAVQTMLGKMVEMSMTVLPDDKVTESRRFWRDCLRNQLEELNEELSLAKDRVLNQMYGSM
jgi:hypothetical protein